MLSEEEAKAALAERRESAGRTPTRARITGVLGKAAGATFASDVGADDTFKAVKKLQALGHRGRRAAFAAACPGLGGELTTLFENAGGLTYQGGWDRRPFRAPRLPALARQRMVRSAGPTIPELAAHGADATWLARWAGHLLAQSWRTSPYLVGRLLATAIDGGNEDALDLLVASAEGTDDVATMGRHVPIALLGAGRQEGWECVERLLLSAQRQEGLRQSILEVADEAHPEAFHRMLTLVREHDLSRFASVVRAVSVWFGLELLAGERKRIEQIIGQALIYLTDPEARLGAVAGEGGPELYVALWVVATEDVHAAIELAIPLVGAADPGRRFSAAQFLTQTGIVTASQGLAQALGDDDLRVAAVAAEHLVTLAPDALPESYDLIEGLLDRIPKRAVELEPVDWLGPLPALKREIVARLLLRHRARPDVDRVLVHSKALDPWDRQQLVGHMAAGKLDERRRVALLEFLGDPSAHVRERAIVAAAEVDLRDEEALALEPLLRRKPGDLRRGIVELILGHGEEWALGAANRLLGGRDAQQRLGGVELLRRVAAGDSESAHAANLRLADLDDTDEDVVVGAASRRAVADDGLVALTEADGFGLSDESDLSPIVSPRRTGFKYPSAASRQVLGLLDALIDEHADVEVQIALPWGGSERTLLDAIQYNGLRWHHRRLLSGETEIEVPLLDTWTAFARDLPADARDPDGQQLLRAMLHCADMAAGSHWSKRAEAAAESGIRHAALVGDVLQLLVEIDADQHLLGAAVDASEHALAGLGKEELADRDEYGFRLPALETVRGLATQRFADDHADLLRRHWLLERWLSEPPNVKPLTRASWDTTARKRHSERVPVRPPVEIVVRAFERGVATEADLVDHLVGPRGPYWEFSDLGEVSARRGTAKLGAGTRTAAVVQRVRERIIAMELARGEQPTQAASAVGALRASGGLEVLVGALTALGRERFVRGWATDGEGRAAVFSHLVATSYPGDHDSPERFGAAIREAKIGDRRLREVACYAPQWAAHIEVALGVPGLADAVWWLHAHTKDDRWNVDRGLRSEWESAVAERTELSFAQLVDGAVDVGWFAAIRAELDDAELDKLVAAAKYGSTAGGHKRAELFANAMRGVLAEGDLMQRITAKRHQDSVRALGLLPLPAAPAKRAEALERRYEKLQEFRRESRQFGRQRQASEGGATDIGIENLARTAGFTDTARLTWAMEAAATADLGGGGVTIARDEVAVTLRVDDEGRPAVTVRRGEKALKAVPAKLRKVDEIKALTARAGQLRRQVSRIRASLERAMVRGDALTGAELARYRDHVLLWPALSKLVLVGDGVIGFPDRDGRVLRDHAGTEQAVGASELVRIAHPVDLMEREDWPSWQQDVLARRFVQPCKQVFRELYVPVEAERTEAGGSRRYAGHQVQPGRARALLSGRGWRLDEYEGARRIDHSAHVAASLWFLNGFGSPVDVEAPALEEVRFHSTRDGGTLALESVPPRLFSEIMRDVDLVVSVAHIAGVDPEASQSSVEMRAALVAETCGMLGYDNVKIDGTRALIDGEIARYAVHLGSATVHRLPGGSVCVVGVHSQQRGRVFLPFADDDPKTAEVTAKVLMLARDGAIRDPTILEQLRA